MANNLLAFSPEYRSNRIQKLLQKALVSREIANMEERAQLTNGIKVHRPYHSDVQVNTYTKGTAVSIQDITATDEYLTVDQTKEATVYIDEIDVIQNKYDVANKYTDRLAYQLKRDIDGAFLAEVTNSALTMDDSDFGGTSGVGVTVTTSNVVKFFSKAEAKMNNQNIEDTTPRFAVVTPDIKSVIQQSMIYNGFAKADTALDGTMMGNGLVGRYLNFNVYSSTNVRHTQTLTTSAILVAGDTITVAGVVFTMVANGNAATAGDISIGTTEATCMANVVLALNGTGTPWASTYVELSTANRRTLKNAMISASYTTHLLVVTSAGSTTKVYTPTGTSYGTRGSQLSLCFFGQVGCTDMVIQRDVTVQRNKVPDKTGYNFLCYDLYGIKTFTEGANRAMQVKVIA